MSQWTHVKGSIKLNSTPYEVKGKKDIKYGSKNVYLPFPKEQVKLLEPESYYEKDDKERIYSGIRFQCNIYSLPRAKKYIDSAFELLPYGESGWSYTIHQDDNCCSSSSSDFTHPCDEKAFGNKLEEIYSSYGGMDYKTIQKFQHIEVGWIDHVNEMIIGICENIRYSSGEEMLEGFEKFFDYLFKNNITPIDGYLEWFDDYNRDYFYAWRPCNPTGIEDEDYRHKYTFYKLDRKTNKILWSKSYFRPYEKDENGEIIWDASHTMKEVDFDTKESEIIEHEYS